MVNLGEPLIFTSPENQPESCKFAPFSDAHVFSAASETDIGRQNGLVLNEYTTDRLTAGLQHLDGSSKRMYCALRNNRRTCTCIGTLWYRHLFSELRRIGIWGEEQDR